MTMPSHAILVLGMHRSGTSAATRMLNLLGVDLGASVLPPVPNDNDTGFWEHRDAFDTHERLLEGLGRSWHDVRDLPEGWLDAPATAKAHAEVRALIDREFQHSPLWAVKDPRMCRLAPLWLRALADTGVGVSAVLVVRHPVEVVSSLHARNGWARAHSLLMWTQHLVEAERATREVPRALVTYDDLLADWHGVASRIEQALKITWPRRPDIARADIEAFLDAGARHHTSSDRTAHHLSGMPSIVAALFEACQALSRGDGTWAEIGARADDFTRIAALYGPCIDDFVTYAMATRAHAERSETALALAELRGSVERLRQNVEDVRATIDTEMIRLPHPLVAILRRWRQRG